MLRIALCDDNKFELNMLNDAVNDIMNSMNRAFNVTKFENGEALIKSVKGGSLFDLYIMDIVMPGINGIDTAEKIKQTDRESVFIFMTTSKDYAIDAFGVRAIDYILKPINKARLNDTIFKYIKIAEKVKNNTLFIKTATGSEAVKYSDIMYIEYASHRIYVCCRNKREICSAYTRESFSDFSERVTEFPFFVKSHVSYIINMKYIKTLGKKDCALTDGSIVPISRSCYNNLRQQYMEMLFKGGL